MLIVLMIFVIVFIVTLYNVLKRIEMGEITTSKYLNAEAARDALRRRAWQKGKDKNAELLEQEQEEFNSILRAVKEALALGQNYIVFDKISEATHRKLKMAGYSVDSLSKVVSWAEPGK